MAQVYLPFFKYQALENDFVILDLRSVEVHDAARLSRMLCTRAKSIGADGLLLVSPHARCAARMEFYNPDGSRAGMCGNGIRCVARFLRDVGWQSSDRFAIMTDVGIRDVRIFPTSVAANLGCPAFAPDRIPVRAQEPDVRRLSLHLEGGPELPPAVCLSVGNPHCVFFVRNVEDYPVAAVGPRVEHHPLFPERINVIFAELIGPHALKCRVWERGAGETRACGTGASAAVVAATARGMIDGSAVVRLPGGTIEAAWDPHDGVTIAGSAEHVFRGAMLIPEELAAPRSRQESPALLPVS